MRNKFSILILACALGASSSGGQTSVPRGVPVPRASADGPPGYLGGYTGTDAKAECAWPATALTTNAIFADCVFGNSVVKITDANTCTLVTGNFFMNGSMETNPWNSDSTRLYVSTLNGSSVQIKVALNFVPATMQASNASGITNGGNGHCYAAASTAGLDLSGSGRFHTGGHSPTWSYTSPDRIYGQPFNTPGIGQYDFSTNAWTILKLWRDADCDPNVSTSGLGADVTVSGDDQRFAWTGNMTGDSPTGQDNWTIVAIYDRTLGCRFWNVSTGAIYNGTGAWTGYPTGTTANATRGKLHNLRLVLGGEYAIATLQTCSASCTNFHRLIWKIATTQVLSCQSGAVGGCTGHAAPGYSKNLVAFNNGPLYMNLFDLTAAAEPMSPTSLTNFTASEGYPTWPNASADNTNYFGRVGFGAYPTTVYLRNEFTMFQPTVGGRIVRQFKLCTSKVGAAFDNLQPRVGLSPDGWFAAWPSDGVACSQSLGRFDVFVAKLK